MTRLYSSFDLDRILADDLARKDRERKNADAAVRRATIDEKRAARDEISSVPVVPSVSSSIIAVPGPFAALSLPDRFVFGPVPYRGSSYVVSVSRTQLDGGARRQYHEWGIRLSNTEWRLASVPFQIAYLSELHQHKSGSYASVIEELRQALKPDYGYGGSPHLVASGTRIRLTPSGKDEVVHDDGYPEKYVVQQRCSVPWWRGLKVAPTLEALVGTSDSARLDALASWLTGIGMTLSLPQKPDKVSAKVLVLGLFLNDFQISTAAVHNELPARGVKLEKITPAGGAS